MEYELYHHGILGMHWGIRRFQNKDGTLTPAGRKRYGLDSDTGEYAKKSMTTRTYEALARSGRRNASKQDRLYKQTGDERNKQSAEQWRKEASSNEKAARESFKKDISGQKDELKVSAAKKRLDEANAEYHKNPTSETLKKASLAELDADNAKEDAKNNRIKQKLANEKGKKSKHRLNLEAKYREKGMTKEEAEIAAYKRVRTEKILAATAAVAVTAAVAYVGSKHYNEFIDQTIKSGTLLQNISIKSDKGVEDAFYAAYKKGDMLKYRGLYGNQLKTAYSGHDVYKTTIQATSNIKVASNDSARKVLSDLAKNDSSFSSDLKSLLKKYDGDQLTRKALKSLDKGVIDKNVFEATNHCLVDHTQAGEKVSSKLYQALRNAGYDAILDTNDMKYSGYGARKPVIVFNGLKKASTVMSEKLSDDSITKDMVRGYARITGRETLKNTAKQAGIIGGATASAKAITRAQEDKIVQQYRKEHPNTKLTYTEILRMQQRKEI